MYISFLLTHFFFFNLIATVSTPTKVEKLIQAFSRKGSQVNSNDAHICIDSALFIHVKDDFHPSLPWT